jgi:hypothetical protein
MGSLEIVFGLVLQALRATNAIGKRPSLRFICVPYWFVCSHHQHSFHCISSLHRFGGCLQNARMRCGRNGLDLRGLLDDIRCVAARVWWWPVWTFALMVRGLFVFR